MITLVDVYNQASWDLHYSLLCSGYKHPVIALTDDGFLPHDVTSPYLYYTGFDKVQGRPLYFNEVPVPEFWEIRADNSKGEIFNYSKKQGHIHYAQPAHQRLVKAVDWYDDKGRVCLTDRYNRLGYRYAQSIYTPQNTMLLTTYFNPKGQEVIVENHQTGDIILNDGGKVKCFHNRQDFAIAYLKQAGHKLDRIFYNSLSTPFFVAHKLGGEGKDVLFWQEDIHQDIPGNMRILLESKGRQTQIMVQKKDAFEKMQTLLGADDLEKVAFLGSLYPFVKSSDKGKNALILTNSDQIEGIESIVQEQTSIHFHIGAITEMSSRLMDLSRYANVSLYPNIALAKVKELYRRSMIYLDINHGNEILSAVRSAYENRLLILAFETTVHNRQFISKDCLFPDHDWARLSDVLGKIIEDPELLSTYLSQQDSAAHLETSDRYRQLLG